MNTHDRRHVGDVRVGRGPLPAFGMLAIALLATACHRNDNAAANGEMPAPATTIPEPVAAPPATTSMPAPAATGMNAAATGSPEPAQSADQRFLGEAMRSNEEEIAVTALAMDKGGAKVRPLAAMLHKDHMAMRDKLATAANRAAAPGSAPADLAALAGSDFDARVLDLLRQAHESAITLFTDASNDVATSNDVRTLATQALPTLKGHLDKVKAAQGQE